MRAACCQHGAVGFEVSVPHYNDTVTELAMKSLVVQLLKDLLKVTRKIHCPGRSPRLQERPGLSVCLPKLAEISRSVKSNSGRPSFSLETLL